MSAREEIAARLWVSVPSSDDAEAKATASRMLDAYRAEVLREAADAADSRKLSHTVGAVADVLRRMADEAMP